MKRIMVVGGPGSGKSTTARRIGARLGLPVIHIDSLHWTSGWVARDAVTFHRKVAEAAAGDYWVIDGNYSSTHAPRLARADTIVFLDLSHRLRMWRVLKRRVQYHGRTRPDLGADCPERMDRAFFMWCWNYERDKLPGLRDKVARWGATYDVVHLKTRAEVRSFLNDLG